MTDKAKQRIEQLEAEVNMLRGVGCNEDGDGPCGACMKCAIAILHVAQQNVRPKRKRTIKIRNWSHSANGRTVRVDLLESPEQNIIRVDDMVTIAALLRAIANRIEDGDAGEIRSEKE